MWEFLKKYAGFLTSVLYMAMMFMIVVVCMYGMKGGGFLLIVSIMLFLGSFVLWIMVKAGQAGSETYIRTDQGMKIGAVLLIILATVGGISGIIYSAIPYHGELSYVLDRHLNGERVSLKDYNFFDEGITRIVDQVKESQRVDGDAYISYFSSANVDSDGGVHALSMNIGIADDDDEMHVFRVYADSYRDRMEITKQSYISFDGQEVQAEKLQRLLSSDEVKEQIMEWGEYYDLEYIYINYMGKKMFTKPGSVKNLSESIDQDIRGDEILENDGAVLGESVCIQLGMEQEDPRICYLMDSKYMNKEEKIKYWEKLQRKDNEMLSCDSDYKTGSVWCNHYNGIGWKAEVTETSDEGNIYQLTCSNKETGEKKVTKDIFSGKKCVIQSMTLFNETEGVIGVTDPDWTRYYVFYTEDGGSTFTEIETPEVLDSQISSDVITRGFSAEDCVYMDMPHEYTDYWSMHMRPCPDEESGPYYKSYDHGKTWEFQY